MCGSSFSPLRCLAQGHKDQARRATTLRTGKAFSCVNPEQPCPAPSRSARRTDRRATQSADTRARKTFIAEVVAGVARTGWRDAAHGISDLLAEQAVAALVTVRA